jgi:hypothetical protein
MTAEKEAQTGSITQDAVGPECFRCGMWEALLEPEKVAEMVRQIPIAPSLRAGPAVMALLDKRRCKKLRG